MNTMEKAMFAAGYVKSSNMIYGVEEWYAGSPGLPETPDDLRVQLAPDRIRIFRAVVAAPYGMSNARKTWFDTQTVAVFSENDEAATVAAFLEWCKKHGCTSHPGQPSYSNTPD